MRAVVRVESPNDGSRSTVAAQAILDGVRDARAMTDLVELAEIESADLAAGGAAPRWSTSHAQFGTPKSVGVLRLVARHPASARELT